MKVTLTHDGKSVELDLTAEQMTALGLKEEKKKTGYEKEYHRYYVSSTGMVVQAAINDQILYDAANYYSDRDLASANARADRLMRELRRFAAENGGIPSVEDWKNLDYSAYLIKYNFGCGDLTLSSWNVQRWFGVVYFNSREACLKAIELYHDELIWYFTEYEAMLR